MERPAASPPVAVSSIGLVFCFWQLYDYAIEKLNEASGSAMGQFKEDTMRKGLVYVYLLAVLFLCGGCASDSDEGIEGTWSLAQERSTNGTLAERRSGTATLSASGSTIENRNEGTYTLLSSGRTGTFSSTSHWTLNGSTITVPAQDVTFYRDGVASTSSVIGGTGTFSNNRIEIQTTTVSQGVTNTVNSVLTR